MTCPTGDAAERAAPASPLATPQTVMPDDWTHVITGGPWPERVGLRCRIVADRGDGRYPFDKPHHADVVVFVENDPHDGQVYSFGPGLTDAERGWTCVIGRADIGDAGAEDATSGEAGQEPSPDPGGQP